MPTSGESANFSKLSLLRKRMSALRHWSFPVLWKVMQQHHPRRMMTKLPLRQGHPPPKQRPLSTLGPTRPTKLKNLLLRAALIMWPALGPINRKKAPPLQAKSLTTSRKRKKAWVPKKQKKVRKYVDTTS